MKKTKNKNKLIKRIGAVLCAFMVLASSFSGTALYKANQNMNIVSYLQNIGLYGTFSELGFEYDESCKYAFSFYEYDTYYRFILIEFLGTPNMFLNKNKEVLCNRIGGSYHYGFDLNKSGEIKQVNSMGGYDETDLYSKIINCNINDALLYYNDFNIMTEKGGSVVAYGPMSWNLIRFSPRGDGGFDVVASESYNSNIGYLQNVRMHTVFDDVPLGENTGEKWTSRWYYDQYSTTGIDLTSGDYMINYYQERWIVKGYGKDDVVEKSDRYLLGTYIVQNGYIETYSEDIESTLQGQGYEEPGMLDLLWNKFITTHYYFQIVDAKNNQVGGVLHIYLTDDNGKFGVEHIGETLDNEGNYDDSGYKDFIDEDKITSDDVEGGFAELESGSSVDIGTIDGVDEFSYALESIALEINNVSNAMQQVLYMLPPWILTVLSVSFAMMVTLVVLAFIRG